MTLREAESELSRALARIRAGNHADVEPLLASAAQKLAAHRRAAGRSNDPEDVLRIPWSGLSEEERREQCALLRVATLTARIADYRGRSSLAKQALQPFTRIREELEDQRKEPRELFMFRSREDVGWRLLREELFCAWQMAVHAYRRGRVGEARNIIDTAIFIAESMRPPSGGLLTQLYYAQATLLLRERAFFEATVMFRKSLTSASERFSSAGDADAVERLAAQYSIGKALALGLAQCLLDQGRIEEAHTVVIAGRMLLELTPDVIHRYYARQLLGSIERASARDSDTALLSSAKAHLEECARFFAREKPSAAFRARYELGLIDYHLGEPAAARKRLRAVLADAEEAKSWKWIASTHIGLSRVARQEKNFVRAIQEAGLARTIALERKLVTIEIEAHTAQVQALFEQYSGQPDQLDAVENEVQQLLRKVPEHDVRSRVVNLLVLVRVLAAGGHLRRARAKYEEYERIAHFVQSRRIEDEARAALLSISPDGFRCPADSIPPVFSLEANKRALEDYVIRKVEAEFGTAEECAQVLQMGQSTYYKHARVRKPK